MELAGYKLYQGMSVLLLPKEKVKIGKPAVEVVIATPNLYG